jgi:ATP-dependent DNA helicase RecQ
MTADLKNDALEILRQLTGREDAEFHQGQWEAIEALVVGKHRVLVVQKTGWGKSAVYFIASLLRRRLGCGPALIVSPLLALMRDQVEAAKRAGVRAVTINSSNLTEWTGIEKDIAANTVDVLLISPERLVNPKFREKQLPHLVNSVGLVVIDEAHCISDWGHDFRPDYRRIRNLLAELPEQTPVLATTATANSRVITDVEEQIGGGLYEVTTIRGPLARDSLRLGVLELPDHSGRLAWLAEHLDELPGSGIIYCLTVAAAEDTASFLSDVGHKVLPYTGRTDDADRQAAEAALKANSVKALAATSALGMGFDKPDLGFIIHLGAPSSPVAYYQQVGRAGRATDSADVLLMPDQEDPEIWEYFATSSMPSPEIADQVLRTFAEADGPLSQPALESRVNIKRGRLELLLKVLAVDGSVERTQQGWSYTGQRWVYDDDRYERVAQARQSEQQAMLVYENLTTCRMEFLTSSLDDPHSEPCGRCDVCAGPWYPTTISEHSTSTAHQALSTHGLPIDCRYRWPTHMDRLGVPLTGGINEVETAEEGRVLARLTDLGWGGVLRELFAADDSGNPRDTVVPDNLVQASFTALSDWHWKARPVAVVWIPSLSRPRLVESLASSISTAGRLENLGPLELTPGATICTRSFNSAYRVRDIWDRFLVPVAVAERLSTLAGPVLLIDDYIDTRWTMTITARLLRQAGATSVLPFALAAGS